MTSLLGRLLPLFPASVPLEDLFTEAVAHLFETRPQLCLAWLEEMGLTATSVEDLRRHVRVVSQRAFAALEHHNTDSRPDLVIEVHDSMEEATGEVSTDVVMIESKISSKEGSEQLKRYAEHLDRMPNSGNKSLVYITRSYDPKEPSKLLVGDVRFEQLRWHDFYRFLRMEEKDALVEEVMKFMEEQGMARSYRLTTADLIALSGVPRAFEILDETLGGEVRAELESFAGNKARRESAGLDLVRRFGVYVVSAQLHGDDLFSNVGYHMRTPDGYPEASVTLQTRPKAVEREASIAAMRRMTLRDGWDGHELDDAMAWSRVTRAMSLARLLPEEDHIAALKRFFIESIRQLQDELTAFKEEHSGLPWAG